MDPATGKILGMLMAYGVSSLGLLLAYYNYRKRIVKAEKIFSPAAKAVMALVGAMAVAGLVGGTAAVTDAQTTKLVVGIIVPALVLAFSCWVTWALYKHFSKKIEEEEFQPASPAHKVREEHGKKPE